MNHVCHLFGAMDAWPSCTRRSPDLAPTHRRSQCEDAKLPKMLLTRSIDLSLSPPCSAPERALTMDREWSSMADHHPTPYSLNQPHPPLPCLKLPPLRHLLGRAATCRLLSLARRPLDRLLPCPTAYSWPGLSQAWATYGHGWASWPLPY